MKRVLVITIFLFAVAIITTSCLSGSNSSGVHLMTRYVEVKLYEGAINVELTADTVYSKLDSEFFEIILIEIWHKDTPKEIYYEAYQKVAEKEQNGEGYQGSIMKYQSIVNESSPERMRFNTHTEFLEFMRSNGYEKLSRDEKTNLYSFKLK